MAGFFFRRQILNGPSDIASGQGGGLQTGPTGDQKTVFLDFYVRPRCADAYLKARGVKVMSWTNITGWLAVLAIIGVVLGSIDHANRTDPVGREAASASANDAINPAVPP
jgi:hypothetical protein